MKPPLSAVCGRDGGPQERFPPISAPFPPEIGSSGGPVGRSRRRARSTGDGSLEQIPARTLDADPLMGDVMSMDIEDMEREAGFVMEAEDRFRLILVSDEIGFEIDPAASAIIAFFVIRRQAGHCDIFFIHKTYRQGKCASRAVQRKTGIPDADIDDEIRRIKGHFTEGVKATTKVPVNWNSLDLSGVRDPAEQVRRISEWGRVGVLAMPGSG